MKFFLTQFDNLIQMDYRLSWTVNCQEIKFFRPLCLLRLEDWASAGLPRWHHPPSWLLPRVKKELQAIILAQVENRLQSEVPDFTQNRVLERWKAISDSSPPPKVYGKQTFWDRKITEQSFSIFLANCISQIDKVLIEYWRLAQRTAHHIHWFAYV